MFKLLYRKDLLIFFLFLFGAILNVIGYNSFAPVAVGLTFYIFCCLLLLLFKVKYRDDFHAFTITFFVCWLWAGVSVIYANYFNDPSQNLADAAYFFDLASSKSEIDFNIFDISSSLENAAAIIIWRIFYDFFELVGFNRGAYIGISVNISFIALTSVIGVKIVRIIFDDDADRIKRIINYFWLCPIFWYFASVHVRDAAVVFSISALTLIWVIYLKRSTKVNLVKIVVATIAAFLIFGLLRTEFIFVPAAMLASGIFAMMIGRSSKIAKIITVFVILLSISLVSIFSSVQTDLVEKIDNGKESYNELSMDEGGASSLGNQLIVSTPLPIRLIAGSIYLFIFPIPFWTGFQLTSASLLFKSFQVLYMYFIGPLFLFSVWQLLKDKTLRVVPIIFLLFLSIGFTFAVAYTSLETRHFSAFLLPILVVCVQTDVNNDEVRFVFFKLLKRFFAVIIIVHFAWLLIKIT
jgi:hypothetical protein